MGHYELRIAALALLATVLPQRLDVHKESELTRLYDVSQKVHANA